MSVFKTRRHDAPETDARIATETQVFVAPGPDRTFQLAGSLKLTKAEADDLQAKLAGPATEDKPFSNDLTAEEYNTVQEALMARIGTSYNPEETKQLIMIADSIKNKFGASVRRGQRRVGHVILEEHEQ